MTLLCSAAPLCAAPPPAGDAALQDFVLSKLARPAPTRTAFVELRDSKLLKAPLRLTGEYARPSADVLVREVRAPYVETTTITTGARGGSVTIARPGKSPRTFSLSRAPELAGMQAGFGALLAGDRAQLERYYRISTQGVRERWTMTLTPRQAELAKQVRGIVLHGRGAELRCIETTPATGEPQRTLLAGAARAAGDATTAAALIALCRGG